MQWQETADYVYTSRMMIELPLEGMGREWLFLQQNLKTLNSKTFLYKIMSNIANINTTKLTAFMIFCYSLVAQ